MEETFLQSIGIDPIFVFFLMFVLILVLFSMLMTNKRQLAKLEKKYDAFMKGKDGKSLEAVIIKRFEEIDKLKRSDVRKTKAINDMIENMGSTYQKIGIVKYDAFNDMGGKLSFVLSLLTKENNGFVLNVVHNRDGCYTYIKEIVKGESYIPLAEEEKRALDEAVNSDNYMEIE